MKTMTLDDATTKKNKTANNNGVIHSNPNSGNSGIALSASTKTKAMKSSSSPSSSSSSSWKAWLLPAFLLCAIVWSLLSIQLNMAAHQTSFAKEFYSYHPGGLNDKNQQQQQQQQRSIVRNGAARGIMESFAEQDGTTGGEASSVVRQSDETHLSASSSMSSSSSSSSFSASQEVRKLPPLRTTDTNLYSNYHDAWYIDEEPNDDATQRIYEDERIIQLKADPTYVPYKSIHLSDGFIVEPKNKTEKLPPPKPHKQIHPVLTALRTLGGVERFFHEVCLRHRFPNITLFPTISVIMPMQNERPGLLAMTVHSILGRTPPELLQQIIIVDDNGEFRHYTQELEDEIESIKQLHPEKIIYLRNEEQLGCAGSRLKAIRLATGEALVVVDSHIEMYSSTWAQHLLLPLLENPRTMTVQTLNILDDRPGHRRASGGGKGDLQWGVVKDTFFFGYQAKRFDEEFPNPREPFETPFVPGSLFAIRRDEFWRLGGYDQGFVVWGGENTELALKVWTCGFVGNPDQAPSDSSTQNGGGVVGPPPQPGRVMMVPCSRVGHVYRIHIKETGRWPPRLPNNVLANTEIKSPGNWTYRGHKADDFTKIVVRNNMRVMRVWLGKDSPAMKAYYKMGFGADSLHPELMEPNWRHMHEDMDTDPHIAEQLAFKERNQCKDFGWFDKHVFYRLLGKHHPWHPSELMNTTCGGHSAKNCGACPDGKGKDWCNGDCHWCPHGTNKAPPRLTEKNQCVPKELECKILKPHIPNVKTRPPVKKG